MVGRLVMCLALLWVVGGCSSGGRETTESNATSVAAEFSVPVAADGRASEPELVEECFGGQAWSVDDVMVQVGDYDLATNIDGFVRGPSLVVYSDGRFAATVTTSTPEWDERFVCGQLSSIELDEVLADAGDLPSGPVDTGTIPADLAPQLLVVGDRRWALNDPTAEPFGSFVDRLDDRIENATTEWSPEAWVIVPESYGERCTISPDPSEFAFLDAPVYPHLSELDGVIDCEAIRSALASLTTSSDCWTDSLITARSLPTDAEIPPAPDDSAIGDRDNFGAGTEVQLSAHLIGVPGDDAARVLADEGWTVTIDEWAGAPPTFTPDLLWNRITLRTCRGVVVSVVFD